MDQFGTTGGNQPGRTYGPRTAWFCASCGANLRSPSARCNCGGQARPEGLTETTAGRGFFGRLADRVVGLLGRRSG